MVMAQMVKNLETWVQSLGWEDPLEEGMATHSSILAWRVPVDRGAWRATVHGAAKSWTRLKQLSTHVCKIPLDITKSIQSIQLSDFNVSTEFSTFTTI